MRLSYWLTAFALTLHAGQSFSQRFTQVSARAQGDSVLIRYFLEDTLPGRSYRISVYGLTARDTFPLKELSGDVGEKIGPGSRTIYWNALKELGRFRGEIRFELRATPAFSILRPAEEGMTLRRGKPFTFRWSGGGSEQDQLDLELYRFEEKVDSIATVAHLSQFTWRPPAGLRPGPGYRLRVRGTPATGIDLYSSEFTIQRQFPLGYKVGGAGALVGGIAAWFLLGGPLAKPPGTSVR